VSYEEYMDKGDRGLKRLLELVHDYGVAFVKGAPIVDDEVGRVAERFGLIRETLYGKLWDVKSVPRAKNIAYTSLPLHFHQDLL
jgi:gamma-butyrobetaine dioxygenase